MHYIINYKRIRLVATAGLIFCFWLVGCSGGPDKNNSVSLQWEDGKATAVTIPRKLLAGVPADSVVKLLQVHLAGKQAILGEYNTTDDAVIFRPLIPFTPGLNYLVTLNGKTVGEVAMPAPDPNDAPTVVAVYPETDTLPENALKMHVRFSKPMQEGQSLKHISLIRNGRDTVAAVFLELQQELWNDDRTVLTLWLDPGRIKRDLQPNITMGPPLRQGEHYELIVQKDWRDAAGGSLVKPFQKNFVVGVRDSVSPDPAKWTMYLPNAGTRYPLTIQLHEPLDYILLINTFRVVDNTNNTVPVNIIIQQNERELSFMPVADWKPGKYVIEIESRLEDLAGNNLTRLFDNDLSKQQTHKQQDVFKKAFTIK
jgi:hypothetical protein